MTFDASTPSTVLPGISSSASARRRKPILQRTLKTSIGCTGVGLHTGARVSMKLHPAEPDTGIVFRRVDLIGGGTEIQADWSRVTDSRMCTVIADENGVSIATVEHLMSTFAGLEIDNAVVEINGPEVPAMDGSAAPFAFLVECAGTVEQNAIRRAMVITKSYIYKVDGRAVSLGAWKGGLRVDFTIDFHAPAIGLQSCSFVVDRECFKAEIARARTFGLLSDVTALREAGLARGGNLDNAVVVDGARILNEEGLRHGHEFVHHKALDALGDLYLTGHPIIGHFVGHCSSHADTARLMRHVLADTSGWEMIDLYEDDLAAVWAVQNRRVAFA
jgi:UDP-3-O-[3-hydroxymyristoyl] N-acetylglucosamine deacetylase